MSTARTMNGEENVIYAEVNPIQAFVLEDNYAEVRRKSINGYNNNDDQKDIKKSSHKPWCIYIIVLFALVLLLIMAILGLGPTFGIELFKVKTEKASIIQITSLQQTLENTISQIANLEDAIKELNVSLSTFYQQFDSKIQELNDSQQINAVTYYSKIQELNDSQQINAVTYYSRIQQLNFSQQNDISVLQQSINSTAARIQLLNDSSIVLFQLATACKYICIKRAG